ncbi:uncharacterized protein LOC131994849 [Stomoxys calcitrans]|uniref:uncharacterized protein LOC131994849 n=1 Tax=Stomoxys calcitrans TaxID=35570 RepID=UPI0027E2DC8B|nr:uncharacterized protein LOC131994849 [Stomoxys calcitrans]
MSTPKSLNFEHCINPTKRKVLSTVAQLFDPAGWITPIIVKAKILMQHLWLEGSGWDDTISDDSRHSWEQLLLDFSDINSIRVPRWIRCMPSDHIQIHGFSDASKAAYCACVYVKVRSSDNASHSSLLVAKSTSRDIADKYITHGFEWSFIPPHAPHMGGLWEAAVKSFKHHFKRVAGSHKFTYEQFATVLARIEGVLNSRPICAISEDPSDLTALTPGHFLRGAPMLALPEPLSQDMPVLNRWVKLKALHHQFSVQWKEDYLKSLQKRYKWKEPSPGVKVGDLVVVIDDLLPPNEWRLGRIEETHPGHDGQIRIVDVRTATGLITRPIVCIFKEYHLAFVEERASNYLLNKSYVNANEAALLMRCGYIN